MDRRASRKCQTYPCCCPLTAIAFTREESTPASAAPIAIFMPCRRQSRHLNAMQHAHPLIHAVAAARHGKGMLQDGRTRTPNETNVSTDLVARRDYVCQS